MIKLSYTENYDKTIVIKARPYLISLQDICHNHSNKCPSQIGHPPNIFMMKFVEKIFKMAFGANFV